MDIALAALCVGQFYPSLDNIMKLKAEAILTIREVADYLRVTEKTVYRLLAKQEIPAFKVGGAWRFRRDEIESWTKRQAQKGVG